LRASLIVPVWNGASVIGPCLDAVFARSGSSLVEVVCVDNASLDDSAALIRTRHPAARLLTQPTNLGFAGGVNVGIDATRGDVLVLLNQDTLVEDGWLDALLDGLRRQPRFGIAGATILDAGGRVSHAGAFVRRPDAEGVHVTTTNGDAEPKAVDYVTGAVMAITRDAWNAIGRFDEGYYPAYYEDCDYCYRAARRGIATAYVPAARVVHLQGGARATTDPIRTLANHHFVRYRFVAKHWEDEALPELFATERAALDADRDFDRILGRLVAARTLLRRLDEVLACRSRDLDVTVDPVRRRQLQGGLAALLKAGLAAAERPGMAAVRDPTSPPPGSVADLKRKEATILAHLQRRREDDRAAPVARRWLRRFVLQPWRVLAGHDAALLAELAALQRARLDALEATPPDPRLRLLRTLAEYDDG
jgi:GT2 family glycosyltransferase